VALLCLVAVQSAPVPNAAVFPAGVHPLAFAAPWPVQDTPEVAAAKAEHIAVLNAARVNAGAAPLVPIHFIQVPAQAPQIATFAPTEQFAPLTPFTSQVKMSSQLTTKRPLLRFVNPSRKSLNQF
jgi:hypothetical protein